MMTVPREVPFTGKKGPVTTIEDSFAGKLLVLLVLSAMVGAQGVSLAAGQSHQHASQHCCTLCHIGPLPFLQPAVSTALAPALSMAWLESPSGLDAPREVRLVTGFSRAPPAWFPAG